MELSKKMIDLICELEGDHDLDYDTAKRIVIEAKGDKYVALWSIQNMKFHKKSDNNDRT